ncbi:MAG: sensor histidine kinase [Agrobacterium albertimagni]
MTVSTESELDWVLVLAPFRRDADYIAALLQEEQIEVMASELDSELVQHLDRSPGMIVITHEALNPTVFAQIGAHLAGQPDWSEVPIIVLLERAAPLARIRGQLEGSWPGARVLFYTRPITPLELVNGIQSNLLVRLRQREVRDSIEREKELRLELNHRVKNILASVQSIFQMTKRGAATVEDLASDFSGRLKALSNVHAAVFEAGGEEVRLSDVVELTVSPYNGEGVTRIEVTGADMVVSRDAGTTIALCLHELITNAIKYGALSRPEGHAALVWAIAADGPREFSLSWTEIGGPPVREPTRQGYGTRYVRAALGSLFGNVPDIVFAPDGFRCSVRGPVERISAS